MASRVKKQPATATAKESSSSSALVINKTEPSSAEISGQNALPKIQSITGITKKLGRPLKNGSSTTTSALKKTVHLKAKERLNSDNKNSAGLKLNPKHFERVLLENGKDLEAKKIILKTKTTLVTSKPGRKARVPKIKKEPVDEMPRVFKPIISQEEENVDGKKTTLKRRGRKATNKIIPELLKVIKSEPQDVVDDEADEQQIMANNEAAAAVIPNLKIIKRPGRQRKTKVENPTIEEVMTDLTYLIDSEQIKKELVDDNNSTIINIDASSIIKPGKKNDPESVRRNELLLLSKKKEDIENTFAKLDSVHDNNKIIDHLDLNVKKFQATNVVPKLMQRRHSIEKFPATDAEENSTTTTTTELNQFSVFNQMPRSLSPRTSKRTLKLANSRRSSPYSTRSDSPARLLRNGKHRKLRDLNLLEGLDSPKRRKRVHSDLSGSETTSKLSGYDSDSSFSDLASLHGAEKDADLLKMAAKDPEFNEDDKNVPISILIKRSTSSDSDRPLIDTNSNVYNNSNDTSLELVEVNNQETTPSVKVPEKELLLDIMKQTFNEIPSSDKSSIVVGCDAASKSLYSGTSPLLDEKSEILITVKIDTSNGDLPQLDQEMTEEEELRQLLEETAPENYKFDPESTELAGQHLLVDETQSVLDKQVIQENDKDEILPIIENMSASLSIKECSNNSDHLLDAPPLLEPISIINSESSSMNKLAVKKSELKMQHIDDHKLGIAVTEKDNVVLFSIEHLTDDAGDHEDMNPIIEEKFENEGKETDDDIIKLEGNPEDSVNSSMEPAKIEAADLDDDKISGKTKRTEKICDKKKEAVNVKSKRSLEYKKSINKVVQESAEDLAEKESILNALGLQSLKSVKGAATNSRRKSKTGVLPKPEVTYTTGTLKTVIKINKKKGKTPLRMTLQKNKSKNDGESSGGDERYKIMKEVNPVFSKQTKESSDSTGAHRKSHYSNRSNMESTSETTSDGETSSSHDKIQPGKSLIVPEKASSFSIHPGRLCKDECSYCFGKFGLFDTPCHIAQMKSVERQNKILATEKHLTRDSCMCDACYRHVDRKSNSPSYVNKSLKRNSLVAPGPRQNHCHVLGCNNVSTNILRRKWIIKMRKSICQVINIDLDNPGLHSIPICDDHFSALEHLMICAMCKRRLARNHIHYLGPEVKELNEALKDEGIPIQLMDKPVVCKLCKCFASILLKEPEERMENSVNFFMEYKKRLLHFNDIVHMDTAAAEEPIVVPGKNEKAAEEFKKENNENNNNKRKRRIRNSSSNETVGSQNKDEKYETCEDKEEDEERCRSRVASTDTNNSECINHSRAESPEDTDEYGGVDYNTLIPTIAMECPSDNESKKDHFENDDIARKIPKLEMLGNTIEISRSYNNKDNLEKIRFNHLAAQKLGQNPSISLKPNFVNNNTTDSWQDRVSSNKLISNPALSVRQLFPGEEDLGLTGEIDFKNPVARTLEGWDKCVSTIQYSEETKLLWEELQKPYGNKSSFLRHLILLEKYFRNGDLILSPTASHHAINYRESVQNRLKAYDNMPASNLGNIQPPIMVQFNKIHSKTSGGGITNQESSSSVTISQIVGNNKDNEQSLSSKSTGVVNLQQQYPTANFFQNVSTKNKPPGLISISQRTSARTHQTSSQKIKFPITRNWRPTLIPIDPSKKNERKPGLVQVISNEKPYHITLEDYKKMCAIKRSFEAKQKKFQEQQNLAKLQRRQISLLTPNNNNNNNNKTTVVQQQQQQQKKNITLSKTSGGIVTENKSISLVPIINSNCSTSIITGGDSSETILEKLDKQVERLGHLDTPSISAIALENNPAIQIIPRIPKSLTVIPQTVRKCRPPSPIINITKTSSVNGSRNNEDNNTTCNNNNQL